MNSFSTKASIALLVGLVLVLFVSLLNLMASDRLERQVIRNTKAIEALAAAGGGGGYRGSAGAAAADPVDEPGQPTGYEAVGWGGRSAAILHVEGALPNASLTLAQKPLPQSDTFISRRGSPPGSLNFYVTNEGETSTITRYTLERLMEIDPDAPPGVLPALATRWEISDDKLTYTYHLRRGVQFADGRPFTSADVRFSFDTMRDPAVRAEHLRSEFDDVIELETPGPHTVVVHYRAKYWRGIYAVGHALRVLNRGWYEEQIPRWSERLGISPYATEPGKPGFGEVFNKIRVPCPGAGPYYLAEERFDPTEPVVLVQNPFYWGIQVHPGWHNLAKLKWVFISDEVAALEEFRKEHFDITVVDAHTWEDELSTDPVIAEIADYFEYDHMSLGFSFVAWNCRQPPFDDARVRRAMTHLVDRQWILDEIERGRGTIADCPSKRIYDSYSNDLISHPFDVGRALALLAEAGWSDSDGDGILDREGERFEFELKVGSPRRFYTQVGAQLEDACKKAGIRMSLRTLEWSTFIDDYYERRFDAVCLYSSFGDPWIDQYDGYHSSQDVPRGGNTSGWHSARGDELLTAMREEFDEDRRNSLFHEFNQLFHEEQPLTLLVHGKVSVLMNNRFEDVRVRPTGMRNFPLWVKPENVMYP